jgi:N-acetylmuramoyl-L-alanine amidase
MKLCGITFLLFIVLPLFSQDISILIDPGHGGSDPGHLSKKTTHLEEKKINLIIAKKLGSYLSTKLKHVKIQYTREDDSFPSLEDRVKQANSGDFDYFVSIHCNGADLTSTKGTETHVHDATSKDAMKWASFVEKEFKSKAGRNSRGVKTGDDRGHSLEVLKYTNMTSILVECGFLTNTKEANYLNTLNGQDVIASAIYRATKKFIIAKHPKISFTGKSKKNDKTEPENKKEGKSVGKKVANKKVKTEKIQNQYNIRLMSSIKLISITDARFKTIEQKITCIKLKKGKYKYIYQIGPFSSEDEGQKILDKAKKHGFKDAFLIKVE